MQITNHDFNILKNYTFKESGVNMDSGTYLNDDGRFNRLNNDKLLAVDRSKAAPELCEIDAKELTFINLFLHIFNFGKLKNKEIEIDAICKHLNQYDWSALKNPAEGSEEEKVFANATELAYKQWIYANRDYVDLDNKQPKFFRKGPLLTKVTELKKFKGSYLYHYENRYMKARYYKHIKMMDIFMRERSSRFREFLILLKNEDDTYDLLKSNEVFSKIKKPMALQYH